MNVRIDSVLTSTQNSGLGLDPVSFESTIRSLSKPPDFGISLDLRCSLYAIAT